MTQDFQRLYVVAAEMEEPPGGVCVAEFLPSAEMATVATLVSLCLLLLRTETGIVFLPLAFPCP